MYICVCVRVRERKRILLKSDLKIWNKSKDSVFTWRLWLVLSESVHSQGSADIVLIQIELLAFFILLIIVAIIFDVVIFIFILFIFFAISYILFLK